MEPERKRLKIDLLSLTTAPIELLAADGSPCGRASGFFYKHDQTHVYYVTNWHVVSGRNPERPKVLPLNWRARTSAKLRLHSTIENKTEFSLARKWDLAVGINDSIGDAPKWLEHKMLGHKVDVAVLKLDKAELDAKAVYKTIADSDLSPDYAEAVMDDVFVLGYPWGFSGGDGVLPLYKRGSIASEPIINQQRLPRFLIDCRTAEAMSGSPVICSHSGIWNPNGKFDGQTVMGTVRKFVGVYSGRLIERDALGAEDPAATDVGQVWRQEVIDEILRHNSPGKPFSEL
jgi:hypothetical protein